MSFLLPAALWTGAIAGCSEQDSSTKPDPPIPAVSRPDVSRPDVSRPDAAGTPHAAAGQPAATNEEVLRTGPFEATFHGVTFSVPAGWKELKLTEKSRQFIDARFRIPTVHGDVTMSSSTNSGGIDSNVKLWVSQFQPAAGEKPVLDEIEISGKKATWVDLRGEFTPQQLSSPTNSRTERMLGVAIPLVNRDLYLKLTGTNEAVADVRPAFREFLRSARIGSEMQ